METCTVALAFHRSADNPCITTLASKYCCTNTLEKQRGMFEEMVSDLCHVRYIDQPVWCCRHCQVVAVNAAKFLHTLITADTVKASSKQPQQVLATPCCLKLTTVAPMSDVLTPVCPPS